MTLSRSDLETLSLRAKLPLAPDGWQISYANDVPRLLEALEAATAPPTPDGGIVHNWQAEVHRLRQENRNLAADLEAHLQSLAVMAEEKDAQHEEAIRFWREDAEAREGVIRGQRHETTELKSKLEDVDAKLQGSRMLANGHAEALRKIAKALDVQSGSSIVETAQRYGDMLRQANEERVHHKEVADVLKADLKAARDLNRTQGDAVYSIGKALGVEVVSLESTLDAARAYVERVAELGGRLAACGDAARALDEIAVVLNITERVPAEGLVEAVRQLGYANRRAEQSLRDMARARDAHAKAGDLLQDRLAQAQGKLLAAREALA